MESFTQDDNSCSQYNDKHHNQPNLLLGQPFEDAESEASVEEENERTPKSQHDQQREPVVSILNLVVDYVMTEPTPLEPDEFRWKLVNDKKRQELPSALLEESKDEENNRECLVEGENDDPQQHCMMERVQVPVVRVFGPILRGPGMSLSYAGKGDDILKQVELDGMDDISNSVEDKRQEKDGDEKGNRNDGEIEELTNLDIPQSGCLHIHGAFPYMIARPVEAGPDASASFHRAYHCTKEQQAEGGQEDKISSGSSCSINSNGSVELIDWDDGDSVAMITDEIHCRLEEALQTYMMERNNQNDGGDERSFPSTRFIRQVTVVHGRGFYTFCNGAVAPFLKVEYYNPSHRWRVKIMLEKGLEVPMEYLPQLTTKEARMRNLRGKTISSSRDNLVASRNICIHNENLNDEEDRFGLGLLKFRCYEAHIPYTMQFFKDYNLSGMSWINIGDCRFRMPLPNIVKDRIGTVATGFNERNQRCSEGNDFTLTKDIIPSELCWADMSASKSAQVHDDEAQKNMLKLDGSEFWIWRETSCDIELDTTASNILNVNDIITDIPHDPEIQWRAVPSLREIWTEERKRMADLLPPKDNFLSGDSQSQQSNQFDKIKTENLPFTLSVKKGADRPGSLLALIGSRKLFEPSPGLENQYKKVLTDIFLKHSHSLENIETIMIDEKQRRDAMKYSRSAKISSNHYLDNDEICDLQTLLEQFTQDTFIPSVDFTESQIIGSGTRQQQNNQLFDPGGSNALSQSFKFARRLSQEEYMKVDEDLNFFQRIDLEEINDGAIDPLTLTHYEEEGNDCWTEEENMKEEEFEQCLTMLATQHQGTSSETFINQETEVTNSRMNKEFAPKPHDVSSPVFLRENIKDGTTLGNNNKAGGKRGVGDDEVFILGRTSKHHDHCAINNFDSIENSTNIIRGSSIFQNISRVDGNSWHLKKTLPTRGDFISVETPHGLDEIVWRPILRHPQTSVPWLGYRNCENFSSRQLELSKHCVLKGGYFEPLLKPPSSSIVHHWMKRKRSFGQLGASATQKIKVSKRGEDKHGAIEVQRKSDLVSNLNGGKEFVDVCTSIDTKRIGTSQRASVHVPRSSPRKPDINELPGEAMKGNATHSSVSTQSTHTAVTQQSASTDTARGHNHSNITDALQGIGQQGGKFLLYEGPIKASLTSPSNRISHTFQKRTITIMSIEVHVQCRTGKAGVSDSRDISMEADPSKDPIFSVCYGYAIDPGGGEKIKIIERGCIFVPTQSEKLPQKKSSNGDPSHSSLISMIGKTLGCSKILRNEVVHDERQLLLRFASIVRWKDPDILTSWDTQGGGIGYLIQRGLSLRNSSNHDDTGSDIDMVRLLGRTPRSCKYKVADHAPDTQLNKDQFTEEAAPSGCSRKWEGSVLGAEWDERVGAGAGPSSIIGRLVLNCWRIMSEEVKHPNASYQQAMIWTVLKKRIPFHDDLLLTNWYGGSKGVNRWRVLKYKLCQAVGNVLLLDALDVIGRAGEAARLSGVELSQSLPGIRGSQYKVEGVLLRALQSLKSDERGEKCGKQSSIPVVSSICNSSSSPIDSPWKVRRNLKAAEEQHERKGGNPAGYFFFSPSKSDCNTQEALECQALTLEPKSGFHFDPVVVCDFTALYPSLIIAYNLCYSTIAGKLEYHSTRKEMKHQGRTTGRVGPYEYSEAQTAYVLKQHMKSLENRISKSENDRAYCLPTGAIFVSEQVVKGVLPSVLDELLSTRAMLKKAMNQYKTLEKPPAAVLRQLEARQLALKYVANVIYGYTSATFSGRCAMPILADAIVDCGRRTLTRAILLANEWGKEKNGPWEGAEVIYGDTDSIFVKLPGRSVKEAFAFGEKFCKAVTASNPPPIQLKLEKVYLGTLLQTKKKYCGMKYDYSDQTTPTFEAKGIETVRKDQCPVTQKILRNALIIMFQERNLSKLKEYLLRQWALIHSGRLPVSDFILTGRLRNNYRSKIGPVQAALAKRLAEADPGKTIRHKQRIPYVIVASPGRSFKLRDCVLTPNELLNQWDAFSVHSFYYATKHVNAALGRCFSLEPFQVDVNIWYQRAPKPFKRIHHWPPTKRGNSAMISMYFGSDICAFCGRKSKVNGCAKSVVCDSCKADNVSVSFLASKRLNQVQQRANSLADVCQRCNGFIENSGSYAPQNVSEKQGFEDNLSSLHYKASCYKTQTKCFNSSNANCTCIDCPVSYKRHEMRESEIEALSLCSSLNIL